MLKQTLIAIGLSVVLLTGCGGAAETATTESENTDAEAVVEETEEVADEVQVAVEEEEETVEDAVSIFDDAEEVASEITYQSARTWTDSIGSTWLQALVEITNTGSVPLYLSNGAYDIEDGNGSLVGSQSYVSIYPDVIDPGETAFLYEETTLDEPVEGIQILPRYTADKAKVDNIRFPITDDSLKGSDFGGPIVVGRVENTSEEEQTMVYVVAKYYGADDTPLGLTFTIISEPMAPGAVIGFETSAFSLPDDVTVDTVARYEVVAYPLQMQF